MGAIIKARDLPALERGGLQWPVIYVEPEKAILESAIPINVELAKKLAAVKRNRRTMRMELMFSHVLDSLPDEPVIMDFDVMFNPDYEVDVLRIMASVARTKHFRAIWPGRYEDGKLIYAEEGFRDYKVFEIKKYDVTCVI